MVLPPAAQILQAFAPAFGRPTFERFQLLAIAAIVTFSRRTVSRLLWTVRPFLTGHASSYHRVFSRAVWSLRPLGLILAGLILELIPPDQVVILSFDDTVLGPHRGKKVYAAGCWRDPVRSTAGHTEHKWGHKWVVLAIHVPFAFTRRPWALPVLAALARKLELDEREGKNHKTPSDLGRALLALLLHWFPNRRFIVLGDCGFATHDLACFAHKHRRRLTLVGRCRDNVNLYALARPAKHPRKNRKCPGRCRKGRKLPAPAAVAASAKPWKQTVCWYGQSQREVEMLSGCGGWYRYKGGGKAALVPIRWVWVRNQQGHRDDTFYSTDPTFSPRQIVELFAARFSIETTFQELKAHLGLESGRQWKESSILRAAPCLFGLFSVVSLIYARIVGVGNAPVRQMPCYAKSEPTFSDALYAVRRLLWEQVLLQHPLWRRHVAKIPHTLRTTILEYLAEAA